MGISYGGMMGHHTDVLMALAEREKATPAVKAEAERQPADVVMCRWLSGWLVGYWMQHGRKP